MTVEVFNSMLGKTIEKITGEAGDDTMVFISDDGKKFTFYHNQDCCEHVSINIKEKSSP